MDDEGNLKIRCRLVAQDLAYGERIDELFAGTLSLRSAETAFHLATEGGCDYKFMVMDVSALLYGKIRRSVHIELPPQDEEACQGDVRDP